MGKKLLGCHDLHTADGEFLLKRTAIAYVLHWIKPGVSLNNYIKRNYPISKHTFIEIVDTTNMQGF